MPNCRLPNEITDKIFMYSNSADIRRWKDLSILREKTYLRKKDSDLFSAILEDNKEGIEYHLNKGRSEGAMPKNYLEALRWCLRFNKFETFKFLLNFRGSNLFTEILIEVAKLRMPSES